MNNIIPLPNKVYFTVEEKNKSEVVIEPLYPGYGVSVGNALRRVLLSSLPGAAVTAVKIKGVDHEFSSVNNVTEDVVDIILNLKQLRLKIHSEEPVRLELKAKGQKQVTAADIKPDPRVEIINPDLVIAMLDGKTSELSMEIIVDKGVGYVPVEMRENQKLEIGMIAVDAIYTPMRNVNFSVQNVRVGQLTNFDKLTIFMETDGTIGGREAMDLASQILVEHFSLLKTSQLAEGTVEDEGIPAVLETDDMTLSDEHEQPVASDLDTLGLTNRAKNALMRNNIISVTQLRGMNRDDLEKLEGLGAKSIDEILEVLEKEKNETPV